MISLVVNLPPSLQDNWLPVLLREGCEVFQATDAEGVRAARRAGHITFVLAFLSVEQNAELSQLINETVAESDWSAFAIDNHAGPAVEAGYEAGFHDYILTSAGETEVERMVAHAKHLYHLEERLAQAQKLESIGQLAAGIAHEINTPIQYVGDNTRFIEDACQDLNEVLACCQQLLKLDATNGQLMPVVAELRSAMDRADIDYLVEEIPSAIQQTLEGVARVSNIVRAMKEFAHPGDSEMTLTDLSVAIQNTLMVARNEWKYFADVETNFDPDMPLVSCLPGEINQVLLNLIVNAAHAVEDVVKGKSSEKGLISISLSMTGPWAEIRIRDTGCGIAAEHQPRIFKPFFTTKAAGRGTGQGLAIAHSVIVEKHRGSIEVASEVGEGTEFTIRIPINASSHAEETFSDVGGSVVEGQVG